MNQALRDTKRLEQQTARRAGDALRGTSSVVPAFRPDGSAFDLVNPKAADIDFADMANALSKIARFNGIYRCGAYSVAQHSVMGADAIFRETGDSVLAGYFVLHDGHEYPFGDVTRPAVDLIQHWVAKLAAAANLDRPEFIDKLVHRAIGEVKRCIDLAIYEAAQLPDITRMPLYVRQVKDMDDRMLVAEALALFGPNADARCIPKGLKPPRITGAIEPWGAMKAEIAFLDRLERYLGIVVRAA
ncbi:MAG: hypothetical protein EOR57_05780 [Mesorhizobium sp.]|uniref:hypothetical protein n=1 Tax=Mesorhizobium sp. TaxID=1871066 RepID=UPI000FE7C03A|nr:hypothetical protein [Mesorhizobium sp.]RWL21945.1 MAG: hypothetical protein EOR57_05780 [Mesorhizobium sp.]